jgi:hypothetical protein
MKAAQGQCGKRTGWKAGRGGVGVPATLVDVATWAGRDQGGLWVRVGRPTLGLATACLCYLPEEPPAGILSCL